MTACGDTPPIRIFLSPPEVGERERELLMDAFDSNWIAPLGPHVDAFEKELAAYLGAEHAVALSSGTGALHLALVDLGVSAGDVVITSTLTFSATANAITYVGAQPAFVDVSPSTWQLDPGLLLEELRRRASANTLPAAVVTVDLYGQCADHDPIREACARYGIPIVEDAAEALGATYHGRAAGTLGDVGIFSFNGNKIITTGGGGALVTDDGDQAARIRHLATQARDPAPHYEHTTIGFNYRMSNLLAAVGRAQLAGLDAKVKRRREVNRRYRKALGALPGVAFLPDATYGAPNNWLTCIILDPAVALNTVDSVRQHLLSHGVEARPVWKPMHLQPVFADCPSVGGDVASMLFERGLCLPSGSSLTDDEQDEIITLVNDVLAG